MEKYKDNPDKFKFTKKIENPFEDAYCEVSRHRFDVNRPGPLYFKFYYLIKKS
jgi:hypothetical protein